MSHAITGCHQATSSSDFNNINRLHQSTRSVEPHGKTSYMIGFKTLAFVGWLILATATSSFAQNLFRPETSEDVFVFAPRPLMRLLREGEIAFQEKRYADGITALAALLLAEDEQLPEDLRGQDYFVEQDLSGLFHKSLKGEALRLLSQLPAEGRRTLEIQLGVTAKRELNSAIAAKDFGKIGNVARKYPHTEAGYDALAVWAQYKLTNGHPLAAANILQRLLEYPAARERFGPQLGLMAAHAWRLTGNNEAAGLTMKLAASHFPGKSVTIAGQQLPLDTSTDWVTVLDRESQRGQSPIVNRSATDAWTVTGGSPERNATSLASMPLPTERWVREIHSSLPEQQAIVRQSEMEIQKGRLLLPKFELRMVGDLVMTKTTDASLLAIDFETGVIKWPLYFHNTPVQLTNLPYAASSGNTSLSNELQSRLWGSSAFGQFSCDEQRLYIVNESTGQLQNSEAMNRSNARAAGNNILESVSIAAEGTILWRVGGSTGVDEPQLSDAYFLGPPLPYEGELYCLADFKGEMKLVVLDATTGRLLWKQQLVHSASSPLQSDVERRSQALSPSISDGVILCPTGLGAVAAVDLLSRTLKWGATYPNNRGQSQYPRRGLGFAGDNHEFSPLERRWQEPGMIAQDGVVVISPPEASGFQCRDILTGQLLLGPQVRNSLRYLAGLQEGRVIAVGERYVAAIELTTGKQVWQTEYPSGLTLAGKGLWQAGFLMLPLSEQIVVRVDLRDGAITERVQVSQPLGNLFAYKQQLLSVSSSAVTVYYTRDWLTSQVAERLAVNPDDTWALNQQSQLALARGDLNTSLQSLEKSHALDPYDADTRYLLVNLLLEGLQTDFAKFEGLAQKYSSIVEFGPQQFRFLQRLALGKIRSKQPLAAFKQLLLLVPKVGGTFAATQNRQRRLELEKGHVVDSDAWIATELSRTYLQASPVERHQMDRLIAVELASIENMLIPIQREKLRYLQWLPSAGPKLIQLASSMMGGDEHTIADQILIPLLHSTVPQLSESAQRLLSQPTTSDTAIRYNQFDMPSEFDPSLDPAPLAPIDQTQSWPEGMARVDISLGPRHRYGTYVELVSERYGRPELTIELTGRMVKLWNGNGIERGELNFPVASADSVPDKLTRGTVRGGLLLIEKSSEIAAFDIQRDLQSGSDALLWRQSLLSPGAVHQLQFNRPEVVPENTQLGFPISLRKMPEKQQSIVGPLTPAGQLVQIGTKLVMLDALSGRQVWTRDGYDDSVSLAAKGLEVAVVHRSQERVQILDCRDGAALRQSEVTGKWQHWFSHNGLLVDLSKNEGVIPRPPPVVRVWDAFTGQEVMQVEAAIGSCADVCQGRYLVILEPNSKLHFCDLAAPAGARVVHHVIESGEEVKSISVERFQDQLVVLCGSEESVREGEVFVVNGDVFGLATTTGELLWSRPGRLTGMVFPVGQPRQSPFMLVYRYYPERQDENFSASLALVDLRSGRLAYSNPWLPLKVRGSFDMRLHPAHQAMDVHMGDQRLRFTFTSEPRPPQPIFRFSPLFQFDIAEDSQQLLQQRVFGR